MKWKKLGKIFNPIEHKLANDCVEYAQAPQTLIFDDFIRIYFSTRKRDTNGKYLSNISFIEMDKKFQKILKVSDHTIISLGNLGCFDEHGIFPLNIFKDEKRVLGYIGGISRRISVDVDGSIGLAISNDNGLTFDRIGEGPILTASLNEPFLIADPFVAKFENKYHMYYIYGTKWTDTTEIPERVYKIGHAISNDGILWTKTNKQLIQDKLNIDECQALPTVIKIKNIYHMFFCYRNVIDFRINRNNSYRIGYAYSDDLINWVRDDENTGISTTEGEWDSDMMCYPHVFEMDAKIYMLYNGNEFGKYGFGLAQMAED